MVRKLCSILIMSLIFPISVQALDWGILEQFVEREDISWGVEKLVTKQPIRYAVSTDVKPEEEQMFLANIQKWPYETLNFIQESGRSKEFEDIIPILKHQFELIKTDDVNLQDLTLLFEASNEDYDLSNEGGHIVLSKGKIEVNTLYRNRFDEITLHELGHYFGLSDQEKNYFNDNTHPEYSSDRNLTAGSIMRSLDNLPGPHLTCDDADGFINLIDLYLSRQNNGQFSDRASKGWTSLCEGNTNLYLNANTVNRKFQFKTSAGPYFYKVYHYINGKRSLPDSWLSEDGVNVISLFRINENDKVTRSKGESNLIHEIVSPNNVPVCFVGPQTKKITRSFRYQFFQDTNIVTIVVDCFAD